MLLTGSSGPGGCEVQSFRAGHKTVGSALSVHQICWAEVPERKMMHSSAQTSWRVFNTAVPVRATATTHS